MKSEDFHFRKSERIASQKQIDELFAGVGSHTRAAFPLRVVYIKRYARRGSNQLSSSSACRSAVSVMPLTVTG